MRFYECTVILAPEVPKNQISDVQAELSSIVEKFDGTISKHEYWGLRSTAYPIEKFTRAHYIYFNITATPEAIIELERKMKIREDVLRYLTVRIDSLDEEPTIMMQNKLKDDARKEGRDGRNDKDKDSRDNRNHKDNKDKNSQTKDDKEAV